MTQQEMLLEAAQTEIMNLRNLECNLAEEEEVKKRAIVHKAVYSGPQICKGTSFQSEISTTSIHYPEKAVCAVTRLPAKMTELLDDEIEEDELFWNQDALKEAHALKMALEAKNLPVNIYVGMSYWYPFTEEAVQQIKRDRITRPVVLPLYPQFSISTTGSSILVLERIFREDAYLSRMPVSIIWSWYQREGYIKSMADLIQKELEKFSNLEENLKDRGVGNDHTLEYQSRVGLVQWLKPYTDEVLVELGQRGVKSLLVIPVSFVSEHIETLEEIDMEYRELALQSGIQNWGRVPAPELNLFLHHGSGRCSSRSLTCRNRHVFLSNEDDNDFMRYATKTFFGSILASFCCCRQKMIIAFKSNLL
ncbi:hypothetical protein Pint_21442 [Pistacia integerrima]|uniref:Uncharacterized protein n=1 Tax=Pistacia integerrima TaxID=434235 RepID=A0ACC0XCC5_9ROSI|nr:hypothetical protein Pint_21442 [Pistacia integerrima]